MSGGLIDALAGGLGSIAGAGLGEIGGGLLGIDPSITEAIGGALGGGLGAGLTSKSVLGGLAGAAGGALAGPAALGGIENLVGGNLSNLFGPGVGVGGAGAPLSLGGVNPTGAPPGGLAPGGGASAAGLSGGSAVDPSTDPNAIYSGPPGTAVGGQVDYGSYGTTGQVLGPTGSPAGGIGNFLSQNKSWLLPAGGLALAALKGNQQTPAEASLSAQAQRDQTLANQFTQALATGRLPPGAQSQIDQATQAAKARVRSQFAGMGLSGSTMEVEALNQVDQQAAAQGFQIAQSLVQTGLQASGQAANIDQALMQEQLAQDQALQQSIANVASAFGGGGQAYGGYGYPGYNPYGYAQPGVA